MIYDLWLKTLNMGSAVMGKNMGTFPPQLQNQLEITVLEPYSPMYKPVNHVEDYIGRKGIPTINDQLQNNELHSSSLPVGQGESMMPGFVDV
ncbi:hypothetical protein DPMN_121402 [Dreissena polymorpha]|uniref:Uncharacterized protein n=1 Tax=Dreissena polymorpha TaxID=45954 RepID=A0A9D4GQP0_DREPO|nr:hypothetical protein DPMN_121402 [Dreissena polymorpha]